MHGILTMPTGLQLLASLALAVSAFAQAPSALFSISQPTPAQWLLVQQHFDPLSNCCSNTIPQDQAEFVVEKAKFGLVKSLLPTAVHVRDSRPFSQVYAELAASSEDVPDPLYYTVAEIEAAIDSQVASYPTLATKVNLSTLPGGILTHEGRPIYALKVSDNVNSDEDEPAILIAAQHHARELNSPHMVIGAMQRVLAAYSTSSQLQAVVDNYEIYFVPMANPDGVNYVWTTDEFWRKNRRNNGGNFGVDLNRNFSFLWGLCGSSTNTSSNIYRGPSPGSEPETVCMTNLVEWLRPEIYLDFHSSGQEVLRTYAPCANVNSSIAGLLERYVDDIRAPMVYNKRNPSASGEAPEAHWASGGSMSLLIEIGTSFQPSFGLTIAEEARVWPGVNHALTNWRPAVRGHVTSSAGNAPLEATITFSPNVFNHGEVTKSRVRDGRYGLWLPLGTWNVTYSAPGHVDVIMPVTISSYDAPIIHDVVLTAGSGNPATFSFFGEGCEGSVAQPPSSCPDLNATGGTLSNSTNSFEYSYVVQNNGPLGVVSFDIWTGTTGGTITRPAHIYGDAGGQPASTPLASTTITVQSAPGFYTATFASPVTVTGNFYIGYENSPNGYVSNLNSGTNGTGYYRTAVTGNWSQSSLVQRPSWRVNCQATAAFYVPAMGVIGMPRIGQTYNPNVSDALPQTFALLVSGLSDQANQGVPLPLPLPNAPGCELLVATDVIELATTNANGQANVPISIPNTASLVGLEVFHQWAIWEPTVNTLNIVVSNGGKVTVGN